MTRTNPSPLIILAAGQSSRMGQPKGLLPYGPGTWLEAQLLAAGGRPVVLVLGDHAEAYFTRHPILRAAFDGPQEFHGSRIKTVLNRDPSRGPFSSLLLGIQAALHFSDIAGLLVLPIDVPVADPGLLSALEKAGAKGRAVVQPRHGERNGHPVWLSVDFARKLEGIPLGHPEARLDSQIRGVPESGKATVPAPESALLNLNTPEALGAFMKTRETPCIFIENGTIVTLGETNRVLNDHVLVIEGDRIGRIVPAKDVAPLKAKAPAGSRTLNARGKVVLPGWINAHMHFYSTLVRGLGKAKASANFAEVLQNLWWRLDRKLSLEDCAVSAEIALIDAVKKGTTTLIDHHASPGAVRGSLDVIAEAVKASGLRACLCYELSDRDGQEIADEGLAENEAFIKRCESEKDPHLRALFGLHASFTLSEATLRRAAELGGSLGAGFHVHTAEALSDQEHSLHTFGMRVVERFEKAGILGPSTLCAHAVHVDERELEILARTGTQVVHNPQSNMNNAVGVADTLAMAAKGLRPGLGTDAMTVNMLEELRSALWIQKLRHHAPSGAFMETLSLLTRHNAAIASSLWGLPLGELREGAPADVILMDYHAPTPLDESTFLGHLCFGLAESTVDTTIVAGRILMENKELRIGLDEERCAARARELAATLWARF